MIVFRIETTQSERRGTQTGQHGLESGIFEKMSSVDSRATRFIFSWKLFEEIITPISFAFRRGQACYVRKPSEPPERWIRKYMGFSLEWMGYMTMPHLKEGRVVIIHQYVRDFGDYEHLIVIDFGVWEPKWCESRYVVWPLSGEIELAVVISAKDLVIV